MYMVYIFHIVMNFSPYGKVYTLTRERVKTKLMIIGAGEVHGKITV